MKYLTALCTILALLTAPFADGATIVIHGPVRHAAAGGGSASFSDDFSGTLGSWTSAAAGTWDINSGQLRANTGSFTDHVLIYTATACSTVSQNVRVVRQDDGSFPRIILRYTNASSGFYAIEISNSNLGWYYYPSVGGSPSQIGTNFSTSTGIGTAIGVTVTGTGTGTEVRIWMDTVAAKSSGGATSWNGDTGEDKLWTDDPGTAVNTGANVGLGGSQGTANTLRFDNFSGGDN